MRRTSRQAARLLGWVVLCGASPAMAQTVLELPQAIDLALSDQPALTAYGRTAEAAAEAAVAAVAAGQLPDPELVLAVRNLPVTGDGAFSFGSAMMTMKSVGVQRRQVRSQKRRALSAQALAQGDVSLAEQELLARRIRREVMLSWTSVLEAQETQATLSTLVDRLRSRQRIVEANVATGGAIAAEVIAISAEIGAASGDLLAARDREAAARAALARWIGDAAQRPLAAQMPICRPATLAAALTTLDMHPLLAVEDRRVALVERGGDVARSDRLLDWGWSLMYGQRDNRSDLFTVQVTLDLPFNRDKLQNRRIAEADRRVEAARDREADERRELVAGLNRSWAEWGAANALLTATRTLVIPALQGAETALEARYSGGGDSLQGVQAARERTTRALLTVVEERAALGRATADLLYYIGECAS